MSLADLSQLTPDVIQQLLRLANQGIGTRSPVRKPLTDLRPPATAAGRLHRPHFEWSADPDPEGTVIPPYPRLYWDAEGVEHRVETAETPIPETWHATPPMAMPMTAEQEVEQILLSLSPEDREFVLKAQREQRLSRIQDRLSQMPEATMDAAMAKDAAAKKTPAKKTA